MLSALRRCCVLLMWLAAVVACGVAARAAAAPVDTSKVDPHNFDGSALGKPIDISSTWLLKQGDDPSYADPKLDDSQWLVVEAGKPLSSYGLKDVDFVWYRLHVHIPPTQSDIGILYTGFRGSEEMFVNGIRLGPAVTFPPGGNQSTSWNVYSRLPIPAAALNMGRVPNELTIAIRASIGRTSLHGKRNGGFYNGGIYLGNVQQLNDASALLYFRGFSSNILNFMAQLLLLIVALCLAFALRSEHEYVAIVLYATYQVLWSILAVFGSMVSNPHGLDDLTFGIVDGLGCVFMIEFVRIVLGYKRSRSFIAYEWTILVWLVVARTVSGYLEGNGTHALLLEAIGYISSLVVIPYRFGLPILALWTWRKNRNQDAVLLLGLLVARYSDRYWALIKYILYRLHLSQSEEVGSLSVLGMGFQWYELTQFIVTIALMLFVILRTVRTARARAAVDAEIQAARTVQQVLLRAVSQATPGFLVESVYHPASEVGGDFFLVSPSPDGSLVAIVGDVSGKGLMAAMRVSMILGVLRREDSREPATVLCRLNEALLNQGQMGFTTACCVHIEPSGAYSIANAGHIPPYIGGAELVTAPALPLGLAGEQEYQLTRGALGAGKMVLMSDGVVEAQTAKGELYGFERLARLTLKSADEIADTALKFGQEDDITVLTIALAAA